MNSPKVAAKFFLINAEYNQSPRLNTNVTTNKRTAFWLMPLETPKRYMTDLFGTKLRTILK